MALAAAPHIPGFRALSPLGYGPTSTIFSAQSNELGRWVALTVYSTTLVDDHSQRRFRRAFETARRLGSHPHAVTLLESGLTPERQPYVASEIYERGTLDSRIGSRPLEVDEVLAVGVALAGALETAHRAGVIHGGLHPGRVLIDSNRVPAIADLNLVPLVDGGLAALVGPRHHVPPEVLESEELTPSTDVFALASTLYTALTGRPPYQGDDPDADTAASLLLRMLQRSVPPIGRRDVPPSLETRLAQALDSQQSNRPATPLAFATLLQDIQQELSLPVTDPVVLDVPPAVNLSIAGDELGQDRHPSAPADSRWGSALSNGGPHHHSNGTAADNGTTPVQRVFVPYQPAEPEPAPLADVPGFPEPPMPGRAEAEPAYEAAEPAAASTGWPWHEEPGVETSAAQPAPVTVLDTLAGYAPRSETEPAVDVEADDSDESEQSGPTAQHARALPVIVLMSLVAVLVVGVGWMIITGEDPSQAGSDTTQSSAALRDGGVVSPDSVTASENASGVQLDWDGSSDDAQVVLVLSEAEAPRSLPAETGSALLVDAAQLTPGTGYCFAVLPAAGTSGSEPGAGSSEPGSSQAGATSAAPSAAAMAADLTADSVGPNACIRGATPDSVRRT